MTSVSPLFLGDFQLGAFAESFPDNVRSQIPFVRGGSALMNLVSARLAAGLPCQVLTLATDLDRPWLEFHGDGLDVWVVRRRPRQVEQDYYLTERGWMRTLLNKLRPQVLHVDEAGPYAWAALDYNQAATVISLSRDPGGLLLGRGGVNGMRMNRALRVLRSGAVLTAASPVVQRIAEEASGQVVSMVPHVISPLLEVRKQAISRRTRNHYLAYLGGWERLKNPRTLLRAYAQMRDQLPGVRLAIAGPGTGAGQAAETWARKRKLHQDVDFLGELDYAAALDCLASSVALVHPVMAETSGISLIEAMWIGIPIVAAQQCESSRWLLDQGRLGLLMDAKKPDQLARGMINAINPPRKTLEAARDYIQGICGMNAVLESYESAYKSALIRFEIHHRDTEEIRRVG